MKHDGHTHTEFCPHGQVVDTELLIRRAIALGFKEYSITEHAPIPKEVLSIAAGTPSIWSTAAMVLNDVDSYFTRMNNLRTKYASEIKIHIGFELDYFSCAHSWTTDFLNEYGPRTDDGILSVHFLEGEGGLRGIDYSFEEFQTNVVNFEGSFQQTQLKYYKKILESVTADLGLWKPKRLGHISLCQKFQNYFTEPTDYTVESKKLIHTLLSRVKQEKYSLDLNSSGFYKQGYQQSYPQPWITLLARQFEIPLVYGSDAHSLESIGAGYTALENWLTV